MERSEIRDCFITCEKPGLRCAPSGLRLLSLEKHPDKTFIGRIARGFDFLGYHFNPAGLTVAKQTIANFIEKASRLYEQKCSAVLAVTALEMYVRRWLRWVKGGLALPAKRFGRRPPAAQAMNQIVR